jgi:cbb3-type cytochrome oxidase maturation protein
MSVLFVALPVALLLGGSAVLAFIWATRGGQFDDLETPRWRMLTDDKEKASGLVSKR